MINTHFIGQYLNNEAIKDLIIDVNGICKMCGEKIIKGILSKNFIKDTFTDYSYLKCSESKFLCINCSKCITQVIETKNQESKRKYNGLRNYSYLVDNKELQILKRGDYKKYILKPPEVPFIFVITFMNKKHTAFKSIINYDSENYIITTDIGNICVCVKTAKLIFDINQKWYTVISGKERTQQQPTWFSKKDILNGCRNYKRIENYGTEKYFRENQELQKYRDTFQLKLLTFSINKEINNDYKNNLFI